MRKYEFWIFLIVAFVLIWFGLTTDVFALVQTTDNIDGKAYYWLYSQKIISQTFKSIYTGTSTVSVYASVEGSKYAVGVLISYLSDAKNSLAEAEAESNNCDYENTFGNVEIYDKKPPLWLTFPNPITTQINKFYKMCFLSSGGASQGFGLLHGSPTNEYPDGSSYREVDGDPAPLDIAIKFNDWEEEEPDYILDWIFPTDTATTTDFGFWLFNYKSIANYNYIQVHYWNDYGQDYLDTAGLFLSSEEETTKAVLKSNALSLGDWYAEGFLISDDYLITYAQTDVIDFEIIATSTAISYPTASTTCSGLGWIGEPMCNLGFLLFVPKQSSLNNFINLKTQLENKPPFGYATQIYDALTGFAASTATTTISFAVFNDLPGYTTPVKTTLTIIIWLGFGFWLFQRVRHFQF